VAPDLSLRVASAATPLGAFTILASEKGVVMTAFDDEGAELERAERRFGASARRAQRELGPVLREVREYFAGRRRRFSVRPDLALVSPGFGRRVLRVTAGIPYGQLWTYGDVAGRAGAPRAARAAGSALARCPIELFVPCHRVVRSGPDLGRYGDADDRRRFLLRLEGSWPAIPTRTRARR